MEQFLKIDDEVSLRYVVNECNHPKAIVLINHGFAEHIGRYDHVAAQLVDAKFKVYRYDLRGHGQTVSRKGYIDSYLSFISDCNEMVKMIKSENHGVPVFMLGHSMGGLVTAMYGIAHPYELTGQILSGPAVGNLPQATPIKRKVLKVAANTAPFFNITNPVENDICSKESVVNDYKNDPDVLKTATTAFLREFLVKSPEFVQRNGFRYRYPVLICHGAEDKVVPPEVSESFYEMIASKDKKRIVYPGLYHEILNEDQGPEIIDTMVNWMNDQLQK